MDGELLPMGKRRWKHRLRWSCGEWVEVPYGVRPTTCNRSRWHLGRHKHYRPRRKR